MNEKAITRTRKSIGTHFSMCAQPSFIGGLKFMKLKTKKKRSAHNINHRFILI